MWQWYTVTPVPALEVLTLTNCMYNVWLNSAVVTVQFPAGVQWPHEKPQTWPRTWEKTSSHLPCALNRSQQGYLKPNIKMTRKITEL